LNKNRETKIFGRIKKTKQKTQKKRNKNQKKPSKEKLFSSNIKPHWIINSMNTKGNSNENQK